MNELEPGTLYIVATPIGNLGDITLRGLDILKNVDFTYAEDTRVTRKLFNKYEIKVPLRSYREAASPVQLARTVSEVVQLLTEGKTVAYVSDAGTPAISDPGSYLVQQVEDSGFRAVPVPGASALTGLLSVSGLPIQRPLFVGFLPKKKGHQTLMKQLLAVLGTGVADTIVLYESPERILKLLAELLEWKLPLVLCLGRELTKQHEEILRGSVEELTAELSSRQSIKGEITLLIHYRS
jgi:16S rRNA (cytidine1402-2'-O)-methyltransferase